MAGSQNHLFSSSKSTNIERILENDNLVNGSQKVASAFNRFFIQKVSKIQKSIDPPTADPMISFRKYIKTPEKELNFKKINMSELRSMFSKMKKSNSASYDTITMKTLNYVKSSIMPLILQLINTINQTKTFPECLKISRIIPIRKSFLVSALSMENYRPVNIISLLSKLVEKFWTRDILNHLKINKLVDQNHQVGYPKRTSTTTVLDIYQKLTNLRKKQDKLCFNTT